MADQQVIVYTSDDCSQCKKLIDKLDEWNVSYEEKNISRNNTFIKELQKNKVYGAPATFVGDDKILGFQEYKLKKALGIAPGYTSKFKNKPFFRAEADSK